MYQGIISYNGVQSNLVLQFRGVRQGDNLSLFICFNLEFPSYTRSTCTYVLVLAYADDTVNFDTD